MYRIIQLDVNNIAPDMLLNFNDRQIITNKWVHDQGWRLLETSELHEWNYEKRIWIAEYLKQQIERGGAVFAAFSGDVLVGFCCADGYLLGKTAKYANLTMLFVDDKFKRRGIGKSLFREICKCAAEKKADKLFISAIPSYETIAFYFRKGCDDAREIITEYIDTQSDRYLEYSLS